MKDGLCPKCHAREVHLVDGSRTGVSVALGTWSAGAFTSFYVCVRCGYLEIYVEDPADLPKIAEKWMKVGGEG